MSADDLPWDREISSDLAPRIVLPTPERVRIDSPRHWLSGSGSGGQAIMIRTRPAAPTRPGDET